MWRFGGGLSVLWTLGCGGLACSGQSCEGLLTSPVDGPPPGTVEIGDAVKVRERTWRVPGISFQPPRPEPLVTAGQCDDITDGGPVKGPSCLSGVLKCGEAIIGHTQGGVSQYDTRFYESHFCWPALIDHNGGGERVYRLDVPEGEWRAFVWMDSPCADLSLFGMKGIGGDECPLPESNFSRCEAQLHKGVGDEAIELVSQGAATSWFLVVEGPDNHEGAFALHTLCRPGVR